MPMNVVDTHAHIYSPDEQTYPPIENPRRPPSGKGSLEDLRAETEANGVDAACKLRLLARAAFGADVSPASIERDVIGRRTGADPG